MSLRFARVLLWACALVSPLPGWAAAPDFAGSWNVTVRFGAESQSAVMELTQSDGKYQGQSGPLDEGGHFGLNLQGTLVGKKLRLIPAFGKVNPEAVGALDIEIRDQKLVGSGKLYGVAVTLSGERPEEKARAPKTHEFVPTKYITTLSARNEPVLHIYPGDSVKTTTVDAYGKNEKNEWVTMPGNSHTGPFYIEGAMPGDTLVVHLARVRVNQSSARMWCKSLNPNALPARIAPEGSKSCDWNWTLDAESNVAKPTSPTAKLKNFKVALRPMIGSIGVAAPAYQAIAAGDLGMHGGNLDYNRIVEGTTVYFPVFRAGALFSLGDAHAVQGDGEITGQGLETSMAVEFKVDLIKGKASTFPWAEDAEYVMFSGIGNSVDNALQAATAGIVEWLKDRYQLEIGEIAQVLGTSIQYDIAEVVDARPHVVAKLRKDLLSQIEKP